MWLKKDKLKSKTGYTQLSPLAQKRRVFKLPTKRPSHLTCSTISDTHLSCFVASPLPDRWNNVNIRYH